MPGDVAYPQLLGLGQGHLWGMDQSILWPPDVKSQLIGKDPDDGKD